MQTAPPPTTTTTPTTTTYTVLGPDGFASGNKKTGTTSNKESISKKIFGVFVRWSLHLENIVAFIVSSESGNVIFSNNI